MVDELPQPSPDVVSQQLEGEAVLVHLRTNRIFVLNVTGARLWDLLRAGVDRPTLKRRLLAEFDVDEATLENEIETLLARLAAEDLVI